jgi:hypothetical protein
LHCHHVLRKTPPDASLLLCHAVLQSVQYNGSLYAHVVFARSGVDLQAPEDDIPPDSVFTTSASAFLVLPVYY